MAGSGITPQDKCKREPYYLLCPFCQAKIDSKDMDNHTKRLHGF